MAGFGLDTHVHTNRLLSLHPLPKILFSVLLLLVVVSSHNLLVPSLVFLVATYLTVVRAGIPAGVYFRWLSLPFLFVLPVFLVMVFFLDKAGFSGFWRAVLLSVRVLGGTSAMYFLAFTTPIFEILLILRHIRVPKVFVELSLLIYRYIFVFADEAARMKLAQEVRLGYSTRQRWLESLALLSGNLFQRALDQGEKVFLAMESRGYTGDLKLETDRPVPLGLTILAGVIPALLAVLSYLLDIKA